MGLNNAFGMVSPVYALMQGIGAALGLNGAGAQSQGEFITLLIVFVGGSLILPIGLSTGAAAAARVLTRTAKRDSLRVALASFAPAFVPIGLGFWIAHYGFHFLIGFGTIIPAFTQFLRDHGVDVGAPNWSLAGIQDMGIIGAVQTVALLGGFLASLYVAQTISQRLYRRSAMLGFLPWALLFLGMILAGLQLFSLPMEMRGTMFD